MLLSWINHAARKMRQSSITRWKQHWLWRNNQIWTWSGNPCQKLLDDQKLVDFQNFTLQIACAGVCALKKPTARCDFFLVITPSCGIANASCGEGTGKRVCVGLHHFESTVCSCRSRPYEQATIFQLWVRGEARRAADWWGAPASAAAWIYRFKGEQHGQRSTSAYFDDKGHEFNALTRWMLSGRLKNFVDGSTFEEPNSRWHLQSWLTITPRVYDLLLVMYCLYLGNGQSSRWWSCDTSSSYVHVHAHATSQTSGAESVVFS